MVEAYYIQQWLQEIPPKILNSILFGDCGEITSNIGKEALDSIDDVHIVKLKTDGLLHTIKNSYKLYQTLRTRCMCPVIGY